MVGGAREGVVAGLAATVEEGPVARLEREELARRALGGALAKARPQRPQQAQLKPPRRPGQVAHRRGVPGTEVLCLPPGPRRERPLLRFVALPGGAERDE